MAGISIIGLTIIVQTYTKELPAVNHADVQQSMDSTDNFLVGKLIDRGIEVQHFDQTAMDKTTLAKTRPVQAQGAVRFAPKANQHVSFRLGARGIRYTGPTNPYVLTSRGAKITRRQIVRAAAADDGTTKPTILEVDIGQGYKVTEAFVLSSPANTVLQIQTGMPLGIILEENDEGKIVVVEADKEKKGYGSGVRVGDILRATSCVVKQKPSEVTLFSGVGISSLNRKALFPVDGAPFQRVMKELRSNAEDDELAVTLVVERRKEIDTAAS